MSYNPVNPNGQTTKANSAPVTLASDQNNAIETGGNLATLAGTVSSSNVNVNVTNSSLPFGAASDLFPSTQDITTYDSSSTTVTGNNNQYIITGSPDSGSAASFDLSTIDAISVQVTGTWTGVLTPEVSLDGGTTWYISPIQQGGGLTLEFTGNFYGVVNVAGCTNFRIRSAYNAWSGDATVTVVESVNVNTVYLGNPTQIADGTTPNQRLAVDTNGNIGINNFPANQEVTGTVTVIGYAGNGTTVGGAPVLIGGSDGTDVRNIKTDTSGNQIVNVNTGTNSIGKISDVTNVETTVAPGTAPSNAFVAGAVYNSSAPSPSNGQTLALQTDSSGNLLVNVKTGGGAGGTSATDGATFTAGTSTFTPAGGEYNSSLSTLTSGDQGTLALTSYRGMHINIRNSSGTEMGTSGNPLYVTGGGGGTQYSELATTSSATGTLALGRYSSSLPTLTNGQMNEPMLDSSSRLIESNSATIATNTTGLNSTVGTTGSTLPSKGQLIQGSDGTDARNIKTDSSGNVSVNINSGNISGFATSANQTNGTQIASVQDLSGNLLQVAQGSTTSGETGPIIQGATTTSAPTYTTAKTNPLSLDTSGNLRTSVNNTVTVSGTITTTPPSNASTNIAQVGGNSINTSQLNGTQAVGGATATNTALTSTTYPLVVGGSDYGGTPKLQNMKVDSSGNQQMNVTQIGGSTLSLGTQTAANSVPVALPTATITSIQQPTLQSGSTTAVTQATASSLNATVVGQGTAGTAPTTAFEEGAIAYTGTLPTAVSGGQLVGAMSDKFGRQVVIPQTTRDSVGYQEYTFTANTSSETVVTAGASGIYNDILTIALANSGSTATLFTLSDGTNSYYFYVPAGDMRGAVYNVPLAASSTATAWTGLCGSSTSSLYCTITFAKNK